MIVKVLSASIDWRELYPLVHGRLELQVDSIPDHYMMNYEREGFLYFAKHTSGYVSFYRYEGPGDGFGGAEFTLHMLDGEIKVLKGPFSSGASVINRTRFGPVIEAILTTERNWPVASHISLALALTVIDRFLPDVELGSDDRFPLARGDGLVYYPHPKDHASCAKMLCATCGRSGR